MEFKLVCVYTNNKQFKSSKQFEKSEKESFPLKMVGQAAQLISLQTQVGDFETLFPLVQHLSLI